MCNATDRRTDVGDSFFFSVVVHCRPLRSKDPNFTKISHLSESTDALWRCYLHQELTCNYKTVLGIETTKCLYRTTWDLVHVYATTNIAVAPPSKVGVMSKAKFQGFLNLVLSSCPNMCLFKCFFRLPSIIFPMIFLIVSLNEMETKPRIFCKKTYRPTESLPEICVSTEVLQSELQRLRVPLKFHGRNVGTMVNGN